MVDDVCDLAAFLLPLITICIICSVGSCRNEKNTMCYICRKKPCDGVKVLCEDSAHYYLCKKCAMKIRNEHPPKEADK